MIRIYILKRVISVLLIVSGSGYACAQGQISREKRSIAVKTPVQKSKPEKTVTRQSVDISQLMFKAKEEEDNGNYSAAANWYRQAADNGNAEAQYQLGNMYFEGKGVSKYQEVALDLYYKSAEQGNINAIKKIGDMYYDGIGVDKNSPAAAEWYRVAAEKGHADAQYYLGNMYYDGDGIDKNMEEALKWYRKSAEQEHSDAQNMLGIMYEGGLGVRVDYNKAVEWYKKSAGHRNIRGEINLGLMYYYGLGVEQNYEEAVRLYLNAAEEDCYEAYAMLEIMYGYGRGVNKSETESQKYYKLQMNSLNRTKNNNYTQRLPKFYPSLRIWCMNLDGQGVGVLPVKNLTKLSEWLLKVAEQGHAYSQYLLGYMYYTGRWDVSRDYKKAYEWLGKAAAQGEWLAEQFLEQHLLDVDKSLITSP
ncbi:MAG: SEL1-like repeat protein [Bacteroides sp.]|nr:SEL1-like repeat protein [Bacteroides sp.]